MYSLQASFDEVLSRVERLLRDGYPCEALVTSVFTVERILRRTLVQLAVSAGFTHEQALQLVAGLGGIQTLARVWSFYDPQGRTLVEVIGKASWQIVRQAVKMRDEMAAGLFVYALRRCDRRTRDLISALEDIRKRFRAVYGYDGWISYSKRRRSALHADPKVPT